MLLRERIAESPAEKADGYDNNTDCFYGVGNEAYFKKFLKVWFLFCYNNYRINFTWRYGMNDRLRSVLGKLAQLLNDSGVTWGVGASVMLSH